MLEANTVAAADLPAPMLAIGVTVVVTGGVTLLVEMGSTVGELTLAVFVNEPFAGAVTVTVTLLIAPFVRLPKFHDTMPELFTPPPVALTNVTVVGNVSVTVTLLAVEGPKFVTEIV